MTNSSQNPRNLLRSVGALLLGFVAVVVLSIGTDLLMQKLGLFPPLDQPMHNSGLLFLALVYRSVYGILGGYIVARFAPYAPMNHALVSGLVGLVLGTVGAVTNWDFGPNWYPVALALTALPCAWLGGFLHRKWYLERRAGLSSNGISQNA